MEPFAIQSLAPGLIRPGLELSGDLSAVLREGRVLSGEVLQTLDGGSVLIGVGSHRVPARSNVKMQPGHKFLFLVQGSGDGRTLLVLDEAAGLEPRLLGALRGAGGGGAMGRLLGELIGLLRGGSGAAAASTAAPGSSGAPGDAAASLARTLASHSFVPAEAPGGPELAALVARGGRGFEARLGEAALARMGAAGSGRLGRELATLLTSRLAAGVPSSAVDAGSLAEQLARALRLQLGAGPEAGEAELERLLMRFANPGAHEGGAGVAGRERLDLPALLRSAIGALEVPASAQLQLLQNLARALPDSLGRGLDGALLRGLLGLGGSAEGSASALVAEASADLKAQLLRGLAGLDDGPARRALLRSIEGLEHEQLLNLARRSAKEPQYFGLPVLDGERWTTAHLFLQRRGSGGQRDGGRGALGHRLTVAVEFSHTGPVRAELVVGADGLAARVSVAREDVFERMQAQRGELEQRLALGGRRVSLVVSLVDAEQLRVDGELTDIRFLREHHLMDRSG